MATTLPNPVRSVACDAIVDLLDAGAGAGTLKVGTTAMGTLLATLTFSDPAFGDASNGVATASAITSDSSADNNGTAAALLAEDSAGTDVFSGDVSTSGAALNLNTVTITAGGVVACSAATFTVPAS